MKMYLERIRPDQGMARFYSVAVTPTLFGQWAVIREWGRIGQGGTVREEILPSQLQADVAAAMVIATKRRRGYNIRQWQGPPIEPCTSEETERSPGRFQSA